MPHVPPISSALSKSQVCYYEITVIQSSLIFIGIHIRIKELIKQQVTLNLLTFSESRGSVAEYSCSYFKFVKDFSLLARILDAAARITNLKINSDEQHAIFAH
jgi:hypothetical protein